MNPGDDDRPGGLVRKIIKSASGLLATAIAIGRTRLELLSVEVREEFQRTAELLAWGFVAVLAAGAGLVFAALAIILAFWETHRLLAASLVAGSFIGLAAVAGLLVRARLRAQTRFLQATLGELARDEAELRSRSS